jgi:hypothetical protein
MGGPACLPNGLGASTTTAAAAGGGLCACACRAFVGRSFAKSVDEAKYAFFSDDLPQEDAVK